MNFHRYLIVLAAASLMACATESTDGDATQDDPGTPDTDTLDLTGQRKLHYSPTGVSLFWKPGCGAFRPGGPACETGLFISYTRTYADLKVTKTFSFDGPSNTLTVKLDTWSMSRTHPMIAVSPQTERLEPQGSAGMGMRFKVKVVDHKKATLFTGEINAIPAP